MLTRTSIVVATAAATLALGIGSAGAAAGPIQISRTVEANAWCSSCAVSSLTANAAGPVVVRSLDSSSVASTVAGAAQGDATNPQAVALDAAGNSWIADSPSILLNAKTGKWVTTGVNRIVEYAKGAKTGAKPVRTITGSKTGSAEGYSAIAVAPNGAVLTVSASDTVRVFAPGASGNTAAAQVLPLKLSDTTAAVTLAVDANGSAWIGTPGQIRVFAMSAKGMYNTSPARTITLSTTTTPSVAVDAKGDAFVATGGRTVAIYGPTANGSAAPAYQLKLTTDSDPNAVYDTLTADMVAVGPEGTLYVSAKSNSVLTEWASFKNVLSTPSTRTAVTGAWGTFTAPTSTKAGSATAPFTDPQGGRISGKIRFILTSAGRKTIVVASPTLTGKTTLSYTTTLPKLAAGTWTISAGYGGDGTHLPLTLSHAKFTVK